MTRAIPAYYRGVVLRRIVVPLAFALGFAGLVSACADDTSTGGADGGTSGTGPTTSTSTAETGGGDNGADSTAADESTSRGATGSDTGGGSSSQGTDGSSSDGSGDGGSGSSDSTGEVAKTCDYPIVWDADPQAQVDAQTALDALSPEAVLNWNDDRGTMSSIQDLEVEIECADETGVLAAAFAFAEAHPDIFQLQADEWLLGDGNTQCQHVDDPTPSTFNTSRRSLDTLDVLHDAIAFRLYRSEGGAVVMSSVNGTYLPVMPDDVRANVQDCIDNGAAPDVLEAVVRDESYSYLTYLDNQQFCEPSGAGSYDPQADDTVTFTDEGLIEWGEVGGGSVSMTLGRRIELVVNPSNVNEALAASNAVCPNPDGPGQIVGFFVLIDAVEATLINAFPGLGCIVC